jgi:hypothetical protein
MRLITIRYKTRYNEKVACEIKISGIFVFGSISRPQT